MIKASLTVAIHLIDTTIGRDIDETNVRFTKENVVLKPLFKGSGNWVFTNMGKEDFLMHINASGYDEADVNIQFDTLDPRLPILDVFLMPSEKNQLGGQAIQINGTLSKLEFIQAINLDRSEEPRICRCTGY